MSATRIQAVFSFKSMYNGSPYYYDVIVGQTGDIGIKNLQNMYGLIIDTVSSLPKPVVDDINASIAQVEDTMATTSAINGSETFSGESSKSVVFPSALSSSDYRVYINVDDLIVCRATNKTTAGFTIELSDEHTGTVYYDVFI